MRWLAAFGLILFLSAPSWGADEKWYREPSSAGGVATSVTPNPQAGHQVAFFSIPSGSTTDSVPLATAACGSVTVEMVDTIAGGGANEANAYIRAVDTKDATCSGGRKILADIDGGGLDDVPLNGDHGDDVDNDGVAEGRAFLWGFGPIAFICVDVTVAPGAGDSAYIVVTCSGE